MIIPVCALFALAACAAAPTDNGSGSSSSSTEESSSSAVSSTSTDVQVTSPKVNAVVASPLIVKGSARGTWYFEASFPVKLFDANGKELVAVPAQAQGDWMTPDFVPFQATLTFATPATPTGTLLLKNDNPSGDPARDIEVKIPVRFR